jgi:hypothetical protein
MRRLAFAGLVVSALASGPAQGAEITHTVSSFDKNRPFGIDLQVGYEREQRRALITREHHQNGDVVDVAELRFTEIKQSLPIRLAVGLWHDLELHANLPIVLSDTREWGYPGLDSSGKPVTNDGNSTIRNNCVTPTGEYSCGTAGPIFGVPGGAYRAGLSHLELGAAFAILSEKRDDTKPTWVIGFDYHFPMLAEAIDPTKPTSPDKTGSEGDRVHRFEPYMAFSKKVGFIDPYVKISASLPTLAPQTYSNCDHPELLAFGQNCGTSTWTRQETGIKPSYTGNLTFGAEFWAYDSPEKEQSVSFDFRGVGTFVSEGRDYNELSDALQRLNYTEQYFTLGGQFAVHAHAARYVALHIITSYMHDTDHFLTDEQVGKDLNGNAQVDLDNANKEINPAYDFRYDAVGRRFRVSQVNIFKVMAVGELAF